MAWYRSRPSREAHSYTPAGFKEFMMDSSEAAAASLTFAAPHDRAASAGAHRPSRQPHVRQVPHRPGDRLASRGSWLSLRNSTRLRGVGIPLLLAEGIWGLRGFRRLLQRLAVEVEQVEQRIAVRVAAGERGKVVEELDEAQHRRVRVHAVRHKM